MQRMSSEYQVIIADPCNPDNFLEKIRLLKKPESRMKTSIPIVSCYTLVLTLSTFLENIHVPYKQYISLPSKYGTP